MIDRKRLTFKEENLLVNDNPLLGWVRSLRETPPKVGELDKKTYPWSWLSLGHFIIFICNFLEWINIQHKREMASTGDINLGPGCRFTHCDLERWFCKLLRRNDKIPLRYGIKHQQTLRGFVPYRKRSWNDFVLREIEYFFSVVWSVVVEIWYLPSENDKRFISKG